MKGCPPACAGQRLASEVSSLCRGSCFSAWMRAGGKVTASRPTEWSTQWPTQWPTQWQGVEGEDGFLVAAWRRPQRDSGDGPPCPALKPAGSVVNRLLLGSAPPRPVRPGRWRSTGVAPRLGGMPLGLGFGILEPAGEGASRTSLSVSLCLTTRQCQHVVSSRKNLSPAHLGRIEYKHSLWLARCARTASTSREGRPAPPLTCLLHRAGALHSSGASHEWLVCPRPARLDGVTRLEQENDALRLPATRASWQCPGRVDESTVGVRRWRPRWPDGSLSPGHARCFLPAPPKGPGRPAQPRASSGIVSSSCMRPGAGRRAGRLARRARCTARLCQAVPGAASGFGPG